MSIKKGQVRCPGGIMLLQDKNSNILFMVRIFGLIPRLFLKVIDLLSENVSLSWDPKKIFWGYSAWYSSNSQHKKNH